MGAREHGSLPSDSAREHGIPVSASGVGSERGAVGRPFGVVTDFSSQSHFSEPGATPL